MNASDLLRSLGWTIGPNPNPTAPLWLWDPNDWRPFLSARAAAPERRDDEAPLIPPDLPGVVR